MSNWPPIDAHSAADARAVEADPLRALSEAIIPAIILRGAFPAAACGPLIQRFIDRDLMRDPAKPAPEAAPRRIDIGTSLGNRGGDPADFFAHAQTTETLFAGLFDDDSNPVACVYDNLQALAGDKRVITAHEPDGRRYGPAIFRVHYDGHAYKPHIDHVILREKRFDFAVSRFNNQFAGILCMQNAASQSTTQGLLHQCVWTDDVEPHIVAGTFDVYAARHRIGHCRVELEPGDLYFFNTRLIHEVPAVIGADPRIVLAVFIGYEPDDPDVFVWS
jgi:hypothetical protein